MAPPGLWKTLWEESNSPEREMMQRRGCLGGFSSGGRVIDISSASKVPRPTRMASAWSRIWSKRSKSALEVKREGPFWEVPILPSAEMAKLMRIRGRSTGGRVAVFLARNEREARLRFSKIGLV